MRNDVPTMQPGLFGADALRGQVRWSPVKSLWWSAMALGTVLATTVWFSWSGLALGLATSAVTLCLGHSLGMHRRFIHRAYEAPLWLERVFVYLGTLVAMAGPLGMMRAHDLRDWAQRQPECHDYFGHRRSFRRDGWWQLHCDIVLDAPPRFVPPDEIARDPFYRGLERTWLAQQLPWALLFFALGGIGWVLWGICFRVWVSLSGHWLIGHFAHREGHRSWDMQGAAVQGFVQRLALPRDLPDRPEVRTRAGSASVYPLTLLYDGACPVCALEMDELRVRDEPTQRLRLIDISAPAFDAAPWGATQEELGALMHAVDAQGRTHRGVPALRLAYAAVGLGWLWAPTRWPLLRRVFDALYAAFARHRRGISRAAAPLIEHIAAARMTRRMQRCAGGACKR